MTLQDPPMFLASKIIRKSNYDSDLFRPYTKSGDKYDYLVWPALLLHENGPVVVKGVAQPLDSAISPLSLRSQKTPNPSQSFPAKNSTRQPDSNNPALKGTPWGSPTNDPNAPSPSIDLPRTPVSVKTPRDSARGTPVGEPIVTYPTTPGKDQDALTASWKQNKNEK